MRAVFALQKRVGWLLLGGACLLAPAAKASSFVTIEPPKGKLSSSFLMLGEAQAPPEAAVAKARKPARSPLDMPPTFAWEPPLQISASIVAFGAPAVEEAKVASIGMPEAKEPPQVQPKPRPRPNAEPKVFRAGVQGHAFPQYVAPVQAAAQTPEQPQPAQPKPEPQKPPRRQPDPAPATPPPPPATRGPELGAPE